MEVLGFDPGAAIDDEAGDGLARWSIGTGIGPRIDQEIVGALGADYEVAFGR